MTYAPPTRGLAFTSRFCALVPDAPGDVDAGNLVVEKLRLAGAPQGHQAKQEADAQIVDLLQGSLQRPQLEDRLRPECVRPGLDLAPQLVYLGAKVLGR